MCIEIAGKKTPGGLSRRVGRELAFAAPIIPRGLGFGGRLIGCMVEPSFNKMSMVPRSFLEVFKQP